MHCPTDESRFEACDPTWSEDFAKAADIDCPSCVRQLITCLEIGKAVTSTFNMNQILVIVLKRLSQLIRAKNWTLFLLDPESQELRFEVVVGLDKELVRDVRIRLGEGIAGTVALTGRPVFSSDVGADPRFSSRVDQLTGFVTRAIICLPLTIGNRVVGVVEVINPEDAQLFQDHCSLGLSIVADYLAIAIGNALNYRKIESLAITDDVTGYCNTRYLHQQLDGLLDPSAGSRRSLSLVFLDLDNFKAVVDNVGHLLGSKVLREVAAVIAGVLADGERLVRYGGDEFIILLPGLSKQEALVRVEHMREALNSACLLLHEGHNVKVTASFGIANYPEDAADKEELLAIADRSMYRSKQSGKDSITLAGR
jgi:diguanylate cyclase (GGDEF)-like protein